MRIDGVEIIQQEGTSLPAEEIEQYVKRGKEQYGESLYRIYLEVPEDCQEDIKIEYVYHQQKFQRLRRITGYLVGSLDRWNDGKRAEERDRVKHGVEAHGQN